jgi:hypothetical protein
MAYRRDPVASSQQYPGVRGAMSMTSEVMYNRRDGALQWKLKCPARIALVSEPDHCNFYGKEHEKCHDRDADGSLIATGEIEEDSSPGRPPPAQGVCGQRADRTHCPP